MKTKFQPIIYTKGKLISDIVDIIAGNNSGDNNINLCDIEGYIKCQKSLYPSMFSNLKMEIVMNELVIMENGEDVSMIVVEQEMHELKVEEEVNS